MKTLPSIIMFAILCINCVAQLKDAISSLNTNIIHVSSSLNEANVTHELSPLDRVKNKTVPELKPLEKDALKCHVCMGSYQCYAPTNCEPEDHFCIIAEIDKNTDINVIKYCSVTCPYMDRYFGRSSQDQYLACCAEDLCNFKKLGSGHRLVGASVTVVAMAFITSFLGTLRIGL